MIIAHPDDEALWGAGLMLRYPGNWKVICCTIPERDPDRIECLSKSASVLGFEYERLDLSETERRLDLANNLVTDADLIVTHNRQGEYGHKHHREVHDFVTWKYPDKTICFGYRPKGASSNEFVINLTADECARKMAAIQCYDNVSSNGKPTWTVLLEAFSHKFNLWREPYESFQCL